MRFLVHHDLMHSADSFPEKTALIQEERKYSFLQLNSLSSRLADIIQSSGIKRLDRTAVYLDHCLDQIISFYGILKASGVYVPLNAQLQGEQVNHIANDCQVKCLITDLPKLERIRRELPGMKDLECIIILGDPPEWINCTDLKVKCYQDIFSPGKDDYSIRDNCIGGDLAALLYTSGSTGKPKGVMVSHDNLRVGAKIVTSYLGNKHEDRLLGILPLSFDYGLNQVTSSMQLGMTYVMKSFRFPGEIVKTIKKHKITGIAGIPTLWHILLQTGSPVYKHEFHHLRYITNSGGALPKTTTDKLGSVFPETDIFLMYGLTEAFRSTYLPPQELDRRPGSMGKAIPGVEIMVVDKKGRLCKPGETGELVHRGPTVSLGYWNNPEKTAEVFKPNPYAAPELKNKELVVYSGDLVRMDKEGYLYYVSRGDHMIKCHGYRISPSEIEEVIYSSGSVKLAAAMGVPDPVKGQKIKVYVVPQSGKKLCEDDIKLICAEKLPPYMIPQHVEIRTDLPRTGAGKIDLALLKKNDLN